MPGDSLTPEGRDFLEALATGDEQAERLLKLHKLAEETATALLQVGAEHYAACREADFWRAAELAKKLAEMSEAVAQGHRLTVGQAEKGGDSA